MVAATSPRAIAPAWVKVAGQPAVAPRQSEMRDPPEPQEQLEPLLWVGARRITPILLSFFSCTEIKGSIGPRGGVLELLLLTIMLLPLFLRCVPAPYTHVWELF